MIQLSSVSHRSQTDRTVLAVRGALVERRTDHLAGEDPMEIRAAGPDETPVSVAVTMRTPGADEDLAAGFLLSEGLATSEDILGFTAGDPGELAHPDNVITVHLRSPFDALRVAPRNFVATASCGICGKASIEDVERRCPPLSPTPHVTRGVLTSLPDALREAQALFATTGGLHACGLFTADGNLIASAEDVGRHNALDKLVGAACRSGRPTLAGHVVLVSGRVSFEIVQKTAMAGAGVLAAISAPTDLAVRAAERLGLTVVGFLRSDSFNVYTHPSRIDGLE